MFVLTDGPTLVADPNGRCSEACRVLYVIDLESGAITSTRSFDTTEFSLVGF